MKTLILVRHAKSDWSHEGVSDTERPLNERGKKDAPDMAKRLRKKGMKPDFFLSSPAKRAFRTARFFAEEFEVKRNDIQVESKLYGAMPHLFEELVNTFKEKDNVVAIFSHNPGITEYANTLCEVKTDNIPTCGIFAVQADVDTWKDFSKANKKFLFYDYPKNPLASL